MANWIEISSHRWVNMDTATAVRVGTEVTTVVDALGVEHRCEDALLWTGATWASQRDVTRATAANEAD